MIALLDAYRADARFHGLLNAWLDLPLATPWGWEAYAVP